MDEVEADDAVITAEWRSMSELSAIARAETGHGVQARCNACGAGTVHIELRKAPE